MKTENESGLYDFYDLVLDELRTLMPVAKVETVNVKPTSGSRRTIGFASVEGGEVFSRVTVKAGLIAVNLDPFGWAVFFALRSIQFGGAIAGKYNETARFKAALSEVFEQVAKFYLWVVREHGGPEFDRFLETRGKS